MTPESTIILNQKKTIAKLEKANAVLVQAKRQLKNELVVVRRNTNWKHLKVKADKYDALLKKYQALLVYSKQTEQMIANMNEAVQKLLS